MLKSSVSNDKKKAMLAQKEQILQEIKYYEKRIKEFPTTAPSYYYDGNSSSDSELDFPEILDVGPSVTELKQQEHQLRTCLQATQELTGIGVLQSEVSVMVKDPVIEGATPAVEDGSWLEVTAECRIDLVPFSLTFYTHQPIRKFAQQTFHGLRLLPVKTTQEAELSKSVLLGVTRPSDAVEVLRSYAIAYRSRRTTLARLADRYSNNLLMEPLPEGGFVLKCADLLKMSWRLENNLSAVAPFHHKMNFEFEYMDESYLKIIKQAHRQLSDPSLQTEERAQLLSKIISTCLEAQTPTQEPYESMESDPESIKKLEKTLLDKEIDEIDTQTHKRKRDEDMMAPPKSIPKKTRPKGKENVDDNRKSVKRASQVDNHSVKKARTDSESVTDIVRRSSVGVSDNSEKPGDNINVAEKENADKGTEKAQKHSKVSNKVVDKTKNKECNEKSTEVTLKQSKHSNKVDPKNTDIKKKSAKSMQKVNDKIAGSKDITKIAKDTIVSQGGKNIEKDTTAKKVAKNDNITDQLKSNTNSIPANDIDKNKGKSATHAKTVKKVGDTNKTEQQNTKMAKNQAKDGDKIENVESNPKNYEKATSKVKAKIDEPKKQTEDAKNVQSKNSKNINTKIKEKDPVNVKKTVNTDTANVKKTVNTDTANVKKTVNTDTVKKTVNTDTANVKKTVNTDTANVKKAVNINTANVKKTVNADTANVKKHVNTDTANVKKTVNTDTANVKKTVNTDTANVKKSINSVTANAKINVNSNTAIIKSAHPKATTEKASNHNVAIKNKNNLVASSNKNVTTAKSDKEKLPKPINVISDNAKIKPALSGKNTNRILPKNMAAKSNMAKDQVKTKMAIKNHRNSPLLKSITKLRASIDNDSKISKLPKKMSPAYAAVLKQNPTRMSPRMASKFKSPSDSNIQTKLFKMVTNIPRLLKKPTPKSK